MTSNGSVYGLTVLFCLRRVFRSVLVCFHCLLMFYLVWLLYVWFCLGALRRIVLRGVLLSLGLFVRASFYYVLLAGHGWITRLEMGHRR